MNDKSNKSRPSLYTTSTEPLNLNPCTLKLKEYSSQFFGFSQNPSYLCSREDRLRLSNLKQALIAFGLHCLCNIKRQFSFSYCIRFRFVIWFVKKHTRLAEIAGLVCINGEIYITRSARASLVRDRVSRQSR